MPHLSRPQLALPLEIMHEIIDHADRNTAVAACCVCRSWLPKAQSLAWRETSWKAVVGAVVGLRRLEGRGQEWDRNTRIPTRIGSARWRVFCTLAAYIRTLTLTCGGNVFIPPLELLKYLSERADADDRGLLPKLHTLLVTDPLVLNLRPDMAMDKNSDCNEMALRVLLILLGPSVRNLGFVCRQVTVDPDTIYRLAPNIEHLSVLWEPLPSGWGAVEEARMISSRAPDRTAAPQPGVWPELFAHSLRKLSALRELWITTAFFYKGGGCRALGCLPLRTLSIVQPHSTTAFDWSHLPLEPTAFESLRSLTALGCDPGQLRPLFEGTAILNGLTELNMHFDCNSHIGYRRGESEAFSIGACIKPLGRLGASLEKIAIVEVFPTRTRGPCRVCLKPSDRDAYLALQRCERLERLDMKDVVFPPACEDWFGAGRWPSLTFLDLTAARLNVTCLPRLAKAHPALTSLTVGIVEAEPRLQALRPHTERIWGTPNAVSVTLVVVTQPDTSWGAAHEALIRYLGSVWRKPNSICRSLPARS